MEMMTSYILTERYNQDKKDLCNTLKYKYEKCFRQNSKEKKSCMDLQIILSRIIETNCEFEYTKK
jgi:hypothetical protein